MQASLEIMATDKNRRQEDTVAGILHFQIAPVYIKRRHSTQFGHSGQALK